MGTPSWKILARLDRIHELKAKWSDLDTLIAVEVDDEAGSSEIPVESPHNPQQAK